MQVEGGWMVSVIREAYQAPSAAASDQERNPSLTRRSMRQMQMQMQASIIPSASKGLHYLRHGVRLI